MCFCVLKTHKLRVLKYNQIEKIKSFGDRKDMNHDYA